MKRLIIFALICLAVFPARAQETASPETWLQTRGKALLVALSDKNDQNRFQKTKQIAETSFHCNELSKLALGRYWVEFSKEEQDRYRSLFLDYFLSVYTESPLPVKDVQFKITDKRLTPKDVLLKVAVDALPTLTEQMPEAQAKPEQMKLELIFALRERPQGYYIRDVQVEGQSMLLFVRKEIESEYQRVQYVPSRFLENMADRIEQRRRARESALRYNSASSSG